MSLENLVAALGVERFKIRAAELPHLQPGRAAEVLLGGEVVGWLGEVHPLVLEAFEAAGPVTAFELALTPLVRGAKDAKPFSDVPRFPGVELDVAIVVDEAVTAERLEQSIVSAGGKLLESVRLFDVYRGERCGRRPQVDGVRAALSRPRSYADRRGGRRSPLPAATQGVWRCGR